MFAYDLSRCLIEYELIFDSPTFIGGALKHLFKSRPGDKSRGSDYRLFCQRRSENDSDIDLSIFYPLFTSSGEFWKFIIPASTIKGIMRDCCYTTLEDIFTKEKLALTDLWKDDSEFGNIFVRQAFGTTEQKGLIAFYPATNEDGLYNKATYSNSETVDYGGTAKRNIPLRLITQNKLDRVTMATTEGLRTSGTIESGNKFYGKFELRNFPWWAVGLLGLGISGLNREVLQIGAKSGVGFGKAKINVKRVLLTYHRKVDISFNNNSRAELKGIGAMITSFQSKLEYLRASKASGKVEGRIPLFLLSDDDIITEAVQKELNSSPFAGDILIVHDINSLFKQAVTKVKDTAESLKTGGAQLCHT